MIFAVTASLVMAATSGAIPFELYRLRSDQNVYTTPPSTLLKNAIPATPDERAAFDEIDGKTLGGSGWWLAAIENRGRTRLRWTGPAESQVMLLVWSGSRFWVYDFRKPGPSQTFTLDVPETKEPKIYVRLRYATDALTAEPLPPDAPPREQPVAPDYWLTIEETEAPLAKPKPETPPPPAVKFSAPKDYYVAACLGGEKEAGTAILLAKVLRSGGLVPLLPPPKKLSLKDLAKQRWYQPGVGPVKATPKKRAASEMVEEESARMTTNAQIVLGRCRASTGRLEVLASTILDRAEWKDVERPRPEPQEKEPEEQDTTPSEGERPELHLRQLAGTRTYELSGNTTHVSCWSIGSDPKVEPVCGATSEGDAVEGQEVFDSREEGWAKVAADRWLGIRHVYFGGTETLEVLLVDAEGHVRNLRLEVGTADD